MSFHMLLYSLSFDRSLFLLHFIAKDRTQGREVHFQHGYREHQELPICTKLTKDINHDLGNRTKSDSRLSLKQLNVWLALYVPTAL